MAQISVSTTVPPQHQTEPPPPTALLSTHPNILSTTVHTEFPHAAEIPYTPLTLLGHGQKGVVEKVRHAHSSAIYARKTYRLSPRSARQRALDRAAYVREIEITRRLQKHRHIVRVVASYSTSDTLAVILEPAADGGDLKTYLARYAAGDVETRRDMQRTLYHAYGCLASGLAFMHSQRIRHRDVKPENILVHGTEVLFADFGISRDYSGKADSWTDGRADAFTAKYCAPEVQDQGVRSSRSDVWALGCVFLLLYSAVWESDVIAVVEKGRFYEYIEAIEGEVERWMGERGRDDEVLRCLVGMMKEEQSERLAAGEVLGVLRGDERKYFCEGCQGEDSMHDCHEDPAPHLSSKSSSETLFSDVATTHTSISKDITTKQPLSLQHNVRDPDTTSHHSDRRYSQTSLTYSEEVVSYRPRHDSMVSNTDMGLAFPDTHSSLLLSPPMEKATYIQTTSLTRGIYQHKMIHTLRPASETAIRTTGSPDDKANILYEDHIYAFAIESLNFGIRLSMRKPYGTILPSLRTFPIVPAFDHEWTLIRHGSLLEVQQAISTGKLHPYVQDETGFTLLHLAMYTGRPDISTLLHHYGVRPVPTNTGHCAFWWATQHTQKLPGATVIDNVRFLLTTCDHQPDFTHSTWKTAKRTCLWREDVMAWMSTSGIEHGLDRAAIEDICLRIALRRAQAYVPVHTHKAEKLIRRYLTPDMASRIRRNELTLVGDLFAQFFSAPPAPPARFALGALWLKILASYSIDIRAYLLHELDIHPNDFLLSSTSCDRKIVTGITEDGGELVLGWRFAFEHTPGHLVVTEFGDLGAAPDIDWPYTPWEWEDWEAGAAWEAEKLKMARFWRRVEKVARKRKKRGHTVDTGLMPGSWIE